MEYLLHSESNEPKERPEYAVRKMKAFKYKIPQMLWEVTSHPSITPCALPGFTVCIFADPRRSLHHWCHCHVKSAHAEILCQTINFHQVRGSEETEHKSAESASTFDHLLPLPPQTSTTRD